MVVALHPCIGRQHSLELVGQKEGKGKKERRNMKGKGRRRKYLGNKRNEGVAFGLNTIKIHFTLSWLVFLST